MKFIRAWGVGEWSVDDRMLQRILRGRDTAIMGDDLLFIGEKLKQSSSVTYQDLTVSGRTGMQNLGGWFWSPCS